MVLADFISKADDTIKYTVNISDVIHKMSVNRLDCIVLLRGNMPFGIFTKIDILHLLHKKTNLNSPASSLSNRNLITIPSNSSLEYAQNQILSFEVDYLVAVDDKEEYVGIIEKNILLESVVVEQKNFTKQVFDIVKKPTTFITLPFSFYTLLDEMVYNGVDSFLVGSPQNIEGLITKNNIFYYVGSLDEHKNISAVIKESFLVIDSAEDTKKLLTLMKEKHINYVVVHDNVKKSYCVFSSKNLLDALRTPNEKFLEEKFKANHILLDKLKISIVEVIRVEDDFIVSWLNEFAKRSLSLDINAKINSFLPSKMWQKILKNIKNKEDIEEEIVSIKGILRVVNMSYFHTKNMTMIKILITDAQQESKKSLTNSYAIEGREKYLYNNIFYQKSIGIAYTSIDGTILDINPYMEAFIGYTKEEVVGLNYYETIVYKEDLESAKQLRKEMVRKYTPDSAVARRYVRKDGSLVWALLLANVVYDENGEIKYLMSFLQDYTKHHETQEDLISQKHILDTIFDTVEDYIFFKDENFRYVSCNHSMLKFLGLELKDIVGKSDHDIFSKSKADAFLEHDKEAMESKEKFTVQQSILHDDNEIISETILKPRFDKKGNFLGIVGAVHDITNRLKYEERQRFTQNLFENIDEGIMVTNSENLITSINPAFTDITGYMEYEVIGKNPSFLSSKKHDILFYEKMWNEINVKGKWRGEIHNRKKDGQIYPQLLTVSTIKDERNSIVNYVGIFSDISDFKKHQAKLEHMAHHDFLTKLPNRISFEITLGDTIKRAYRHGFKVGVLFFDIDNFKEINDTYGHSIGDKVLIQVSNRIKKLLREGDVVGRIGGDEFVIMVVDIHSKSDLEEIIRKIFHIFKSPFIVEDKIFNISSSLGASIYPQDGEDKETLVKNADAAMYQAKKLGKNNYKFYTSDLTNTLFQKIEMMTDIRRAIKNEEFTLYYQPQFDIVSNKLIGAEALARWEHPIKGLVFPDEFIALAEESQLIIQIGRQLFKKACKDIYRWLDTGVELEDFRLSVNISAVQVAHDDIYKMVKETMEQVGVNPSYIELELTETSIMKDPNGAVALFDDLKKLGLTLAIDDFGIGYSSLSYLKKFAIDKIKIDRSFIMDIPYDKDDIAITKAIIALGKSLNVDVIAEGIENNVQKYFLIEEGCSTGQGYFYSKPIHVKDFEEMFLYKSTKKL